MTEPAGKRKRGRPKNYLGCQPPNTLNYDDAPGCYGSVVWQMQSWQPELGVGGAACLAVWRDAKITRGVERFFCSIFQGTLCEYVRIGLFGRSKPTKTERRQAYDPFLLRLPSFKAQAIARQCKASTVWTVLSCAYTR